MAPDPYTSSLPYDVEQSTVGLTRFIVVTNDSGQGHVGSGVHAAGLVNDELFELLTLVIAHVSLPIIEAAGIVANSINLVIFSRIGLRDSVSSSFFALSLSDLCYLVTAEFTWLCFTLGEFTSPGRISFAGLSYLAVWYCHLFLASSILITTYISIQRCCCVALPLKFKGVFTPRRNTAIIVVLFIVSVGMYVPVISHQGMRYFTNTITNSTRYGLWFSENRKSVLIVNDYVIGTIFPIFTQVVTVICMVILISSLRKSSQFRKATASGGQSDSTEVKAKSKEVQVVKAVTIVTLMFITSNVPAICIALARRLIPEYDIYKLYSNLFVISNIFKDAVQYLNASLNILVYYNFNSSYRSLFRQMITLKCGLYKSEDVKIGK